MKKTETYNDGIYASGYVYTSPYRNPRTSKRVTDRSVTMVIIVSVSFALGVVAGFLIR